jgi:flavin reductase (DIM6/NTAB) family NADH-FMN oxidoreductase RutF
MTTLNSFESWNKTFRTLFFNSLHGYRSPVLIGTSNAENKTNLAIFNSIAHLGANPSLCSILVRPAAVERHTLSNIRATGFFTVNHVNAKMMERAHQTSARYVAEISEFEACGFEPEYTSFKAPYVTESVIKYGVEMVEEHRLEINDTILVIGKIVEVLVPENLISEDGFVNHHSAESLVVSGLDAYLAPNPITRLSYAKPNKPLKRF